MRLTGRALVSVVVVFCCCQDIWATETGSRWWPFGHKQETAPAPPSATATPSPSPYVHSPAAGTMNGAYPSTSPTPQQTLPVPNDEPETTHWMFKSPRTKVSWPSFHAPKFHNPFTGSDADKTAAASRNTWVEKTPEPPRRSPMQVMNDGAKRVGNSTKNAWHKTVDVLTPGESSTASSPRSKLAERPVKPPFWKRMFGQDDQLQGPQTVPEWMAQQRVQP